MLAICCMSSCVGHMLGHAGPMLLSLLGLWWRILGPLGHVEPKFGNLADFRSLLKDAENYKILEQSKPPKLKLSSYFNCCWIKRAHKKRLGTFGAGRISFVNVPSEFVVSQSLASCRAIHVFSDGSPIEHLTTVWLLLAEADESGQVTVKCFFDWTFPSLEIWLKSTGWIPTHQYSRDPKRNIASVFILYILTPRYDRIRDDRRRAVGISESCNQYGRFVVRWMTDHLILVSSNLISSNIIRYPISKFTWPWTPLRKDIESPRFICV